MSKTPLTAINCTRKPINGCADWHYGRPHKSHMADFNESIFMAEDRTVVSIQKRLTRIINVNTYLIFLRFTLVSFFLLFITTISFTYAVAQDASDPIPIMAYYYIWFDTSSWDRAKTDYPELGRYSSDDPEIMEQHIIWAKEAGIDGFIVSWKSTFQLDTRLEILMDIAEKHDFHLWIIYQGLDFERNPLSVDRIESDLEHFAEQYANHPAYQMYDHPIFIWSGTWKFSRDEIESLTSRYRDQFYILASERNIDGYLNIADLVDGNAYYWSSVDPATSSTYQERLNEMGKIVHDFGGLWIAPASPGFDARLIGGRIIIERNDGETLSLTLNGAIRSNADAVGLISWNEFSENTHIEPSLTYGTQALDILAGRESVQIPIILDFDSSAPGTLEMSNYYPFIILIGLTAFVMMSIAVIIYREL